MNERTMQRELSIPKMSKEVLLLLLEYIYTDELRKDELTRTYVRMHLRICSEALNKTAKQSVKCRQACWNLLRSTAWRDWSNSVN